MSDNEELAIAADRMLTDHAELMALLAESAPASDVVTVVDAMARRAHAGPSGERLREQTLRVKDLLDRRARRDRDSSALFETARDLATLSTLPAVLASIAARCRELVGTDLAYLSLVDDSGTETSIRVADGTVSALLQHLRLPLDVGIAGRIVLTGVSHQSSDYLRDHRFEHGDEVDAAFAAEGITAIVGVPLRVSDASIGILFAAHRSQRIFSADEVEVLTSLATLAALAIEKTRLIEQSRDDLAEVKNEHAITLEYQAAVDRGAVAHELFTSIVFRGGGLDELTAALADVLAIPAVILDVDGDLLASAGFGRVPEQLPSIPAGDPATGGSRVVYEGEWTIVPIEAVHDRFGAIALRYPEPMSEHDVRIAARAATVAALLLFWRQSLAEASGRDRSALLIETVCRPAGTRPALPPSVSFPHLPDDAGWHVYAICTAAPDHRLLAALGREFASPHVMHVRHDGEMIVATWSPGAVPSAADMAPRLAAELGADVIMGESTSSAGLAGLHEAYEEASMCLKALRTLGRQRAGANRSRLGVAGLLLSDSRDLNSFVAHQLGPVLEYDQRRGTNLTMTLDSYFRTNRNVNETAQDLRVHPNTVTQRLARIDILLGPTWRDAAASLDVQLSLLIHTVVGHLDLG